MQSDELKKHIESMLGGTGDNKVKVELSTEDFNEIEKSTLAQIAPYYSGRRFVVADSNVVDLSHHEPIAIVNVFDTSDEILLSAEDFAFGGQNIIIYNSDFTQRYASYVAYKMLYKEYNYQKAQNWKLIGTTLYIHGFNKQTLIEMIVNPRTMSDVEKNSEWYPWVLDYALALAKEIVGRKRSKYIVEGSPYQLDGDKLLSEGLEEQEALKSKLTGDIFVI